MRLSANRFFIAVCKTCLQDAIFGESVGELANALNQAAALDLRVNILKSDRDTVVGTLKQEGFAVEVGKHSPFAVRLAGKPALAKHPLFLAGHIEVQDEGSQLLGLMLAVKRGEAVADFCAGAGGKTLLLGMLMKNTGRLYAFGAPRKTPFPKTLPQEFQGFAVTRYGL